MERRVALLHDDQIEKDLRRSARAANLREIAIAISSSSPDPETRRAG